MKLNRGWLNEAGGGGVGQKLVQKAYGIQVNILLKTAKMKRVEPKQVF